MSQHDSATQALAEALLARPSVTPDDAGCQQLIAERLQRLGFQIEHLPFGAVSNLWARRGQTAPVLVLAGHTDVVPPGNLAGWVSPPFQPTVRDGILYARGSADMKGSLAAMVTACERFLANHPEHRGSIAFLLTSDEEGPAQDGIRRVVETLQARSEPLDWCLLGEPSCSQRLGDTLKNGRRGSLHGQLAIIGREGHVAYPQQVLNPIPVLGGIVHSLAEQVWDEGNDFFPPTSFQVTRLQAEGSVNVVPREAHCRFNFRFCTEQTPESLEARVKTLVETALLNEEMQHGGIYQYQLHWELSGLPFVTEPGELLAALSQAIITETGAAPTLSTSGGTSDGRFIAPLGTQVVEFGPVNSSIHQDNEALPLADLTTLSRIYEDTLVRLLAS